MKKLTTTQLTGFVVALTLTSLPAVFGQSKPEAAGAEPETSMAAAHECFLKKDMDGAAKHIHNASVAVKADSEKVCTGAKAGMKKAGDDLDKLGEGIKSGAVKSDEEVRHTFAKVNHQIATCWHQTAEDSKESGKDVGGALKKTGTALADASKWSGHKLGEGAQASVDGVKKAGVAVGKGVKSGADAVGKGVKTGAEDVGKWFKGLGEGIKDLGTKL